MKIREVGKFKILDVIGEGSFGKVYKGIDRTNDQEVALKFITRKGKTKRELDNLRQEIQILKKLKHPNIIALKDHIETQNQFIVVTEFAGQDLSVVLEKQSKFKTDKVRQFGSQILSALLYLNDNRIVHRDLKPQNILIKEGIIKICDFGFARKMSAMTMQLHSLKGTPLYIAPEIVSQKPYNHKVDVWSLGIILFELAVGRTPFYAENYHKLIPKILNDKVRYPKDMDVSLRDLIDGMLQKTPSSRYDWNQIINHPFMKAKSPLLEVVQPNPKQQKNQDQFEEYFPMDPKNFRSSVLMNNKDKVQINELRKYEQDIKQGKQAGKQLKTNILFYHQLISLFAGYSMGEIVSKQYLVLAMRILSRLVSQVKLEGDLRDDDITKKPDLLNSIISMIPAITDDEVLAQTYLIVGYLLKCNFDSLNLDLDFCQKFMIAAKISLEKNNIDKSVYSNIIKVLGILAAQSLLTLKNSQEFFDIVSNSQILYLLTSNFVAQKQIALVLFECLTKFIHPSKGEQPTKTSNFIESLTQLKVQVGQGFQSSAKSLPFFAQIVETCNQSQLANFNAIFYECIKFSSKFRSGFINSKYITIFQKIPMYNIPMAYYMMKFEGKQVINTDIIKMQISQESEIQHPLHRAFEINFLILTMNLKADISVKLEQMKFYLHKMLEVLKLDEVRKQKSIENLEGWAFGCLPYKFDDIVVSAFMQLHSLDRTLQRQFIKTCQQINIFEHMLRIHKDDVNLSVKYFMKLLPFLITHYRESQKPSKKLLLAASQTLLIYLCPEQVNKMKSNQGNKDALISYLQNCFVLIEQLASKDDKKLNDFFLKAQNIGLHRLLMDQDLMIERLLPYSLKLLYKMIQKSPPAILDFVAVYGLTKLGKYCRQTTQSITLEIIQIVSHLARTKSDYYPNIASLKIVQLIPKWLSSDNEQLTYRTLNLVGNLAKHSVYFFQQFSKYKIVPSIVSTIHHTKNFQKNVIYAIGNISFYNQQFKEDIKPMIPYLSKTLDLDDEHLLSNSISTLSNLLRHSNYFIKDLLACNVIPKILQIITRSKIQNLIQFGLNFLLKAVNYKQITTKEDLKELIKASLRKIVCAMDSQIFKKIQKIQDKL